MGDLATDGGRGSGKTRAGAEWIRERVAWGGCRHIALVAPNLSDGREVMLNGDSGLLRIGYPSERPQYISSRRRLEWPNGAVGHIFSAEDPDSLRGPQFDVAWADEFCAWRHPDETLSNLRLALRLGDDPKLVVTTTPRPIPALKKLLQTPDLVISRAKTSDNARHLAASFLEAMAQTYGGTRLGRQELDGDLIEDHPGALWTRHVIDAARIAAAPELSRIIVSIDPPTTSGPKADRCGLVVAGRVGEGRDAKAYILQDGSEQGLSPEGWARRAIALFHTWEADCLLAETNQGGDMIRTILAQIDPNIPLRTVHASRGKITRAEPVAALYEQGRVRHVGQFSELEDELAMMGSPVMRGSPDRVDALVWAVSHLLIANTASPRIRGLF
ncbi:DNA-packaging protein [Litorimonas sp. RW-G-Af-16]|uniref:DNA-packaging protein n=1 Tax=Litorimonas sp. RW-G-Af-16 TaxID=3241168 RepID=UPI003AAC5BF9